MKLNYAVLLALGTLLTAGGLEAKKVLDHTSFDDWKGVRNHILSRDGRWGTYSVNPQQGDGVLVFYNTSGGKKIEISRGYSPAFTADGRWGIARIKPLYADTRQAKIDKKKDFDMPQDSLAIVNLQTGAVERIGSVISYSVGEEGGEWLAYLSCDTTLVAPKALKDKEAGRPLVVRHLPSGTSKTISWAKDYIFSRDGRRLAIAQKHHGSDTIATDALGIINLPDTNFILIDRDRKHYGSPVFSRQGDRLAFTVSDDTVKSGTRQTILMLADLGEAYPVAEEISFAEFPGGRVHLAQPHASDPELQEKLMQEWAEANRRQNEKGLFLNQYSKPVFSEDGRRLIVGLAPRVAPDDTTIVDFEHPMLDIWRWDAPYTPPQEKHQADKSVERTFPVVLDLNSRNHQLLTYNPLVTVVAPDRWNGQWALLRDPSETIVSQQWDYYAPEELSIINVSTGEKRKVGEAYQETAELSPSGKYVIWFDDRDYFVYDIATGETRNISAGMDVTLWDETDDHPMVAQPYGLASWTAGDGKVLVYDRFDIWELDPKGVAAPVNLTLGDGRKNNRRYRYVNTDREDRRFLSGGDEMLLDVFDYQDKRNGVAMMKYGKAAKPDLKVLDGHSYTQLRRAKNTPVFSFVRANFSELPDVYVTRNQDFARPLRLSDANPQVKEYNWGTAQLVEWRAYDGTLTQGVLYLPEDLDPSKKYPMLSVFYETGSEDLYTHYTMEPSWSWVNYPFYVSRGYVVFVPDIHYTAGVPGECAWNFVCSGVEEMCRRYSFIDKDRLGIDGQSWGGYQTAYLVTRTDMFACAGSGAPVANMTSAFGGIRWESGSSRQAQYEMGQSRIGRNLWEAPELYIANSPVFHADRVETPLLIMHNDADGAVPWYQGIEMFMALRRLGKPVWMLQYNGEAHNLRERKNRKDITVRLQQFFDHYLKGDPMPEWMKNGVPYTRKSQELGY